MSADRVEAEFDVDETDDGSLTARLEVDLTELFVDGILWLEESDAGRIGIERDVDAYYFVDTRQPEDSWARRLRIGQQAVRGLVARYLSDEAVDAKGWFA